ncbi:MULTISPECIES: polysaccharide pyruvyl transferase family protein [unclassified Microbacterium]|uniref:polysaccharide pyruvyl transferase family protein n=1 Tax=unclassified Microbacterium TaxID=2609290 RepID=UPI00301AC32F
MANIGDMAHAPSAIGLLARHAPDIDVVLWARRISDTERRTLTSWYPGLRIVTGEVDELGRLSTPELQEEFDACDFLLHGSGRLLAGEPDVIRWRQLTGRPYGFLGISVDPLSPPVDGSHGWVGPLAEMDDIVRHLGDTHMTAQRRQLLSEASFVYCRDSISARYLAQHGLGPSEAVGFGPDAVFAFAPPGGVRPHLELQRSLSLGNEPYACVVPRLRYTPYHRSLGLPVGQAEMLKDAINAASSDREFDALRAVIIDLVRERGLRVLICPEMDYAGPLGAQIAAELPDDVRERVSALIDFWDPESATAIYADAAVVVSMECHSPILAARVGVPALYVRQPTDTIKGAMWADLGLSDRILEVEDATGDELVAATSRILDDLAGARADIVAKAAAASERLDTMAVFAGARIREAATTRALVAEVRA